MQNQIGFTLTLQQPFEQAVETVIAALKTQGFGVLTRIDVRATMKEKLDVDFRPYVILGACNPPLAHRALTRAPEVGLMLPCNVTIEAVQSGQSLVRLANPAAMVLAVNRPGDTELETIAAEALQKMEKVVEALQPVSV
jgi:uncharacterized protein (DUF302 family)